MVRPSDSSAVRRSSVTVSVVARICCVSTVEEVIPRVHQMHLLGDGFPAVHPSYVIVDYISTQGIRSRILEEVDRIYRINRTRTRDRS